MFYLKQLGDHHSWELSRNTILKKGGGERNDDEEWNVKCVWEKKKRKCITLFASLAMSAPQLTWITFLTLTWSILVLFFYWCFFVVKRIIILFVMRVCLCVCVFSSLYLYWRFFNFKFTFLFQKTVPSFVVVFSKNIPFSHIKKIPGFNIWNPNPNSIPKSISFPISNFKIHYSNSHFQFIFIKKKKNSLLLSLFLGKRVWNSPTRLRPLQPTHKEPCRYQRRRRRGRRRQWRRRGR